MVTNEELAKIFREIGDYLEIKNTPFKPRAYRNAAQVIEGLARPAVEIYKEGGIEALEKLPGIGKNIASKIEEIIKTGQLKYYQKLKREFPVEVETLSKIEGLGPKKIYQLYRRLKVKDLNDLERAINSRQVRALPGFGPKTEENILKGLNFVRSAQSRFVLGWMMPVINSIISRLQARPEVTRTALAGSARRFKETIGDIDILAVSKKPEETMAYFVSMPEVANITAHGPDKSSVKLKTGIDVDLRIVPPESFGAALNYFTGSKAHNIALRRIALAKGWKLNEYGLFERRGGNFIKIGGKTEADLYQKLGLIYIEPEMRENAGEIEAAKKGKLPKLVSRQNIKGDLQVHTKWSDGENSIEEMALSAAKRGLNYIAVTDHTKSLAVAKGLNEEEIIRQWRAIDKINQKLKRQGYRLKILKGTECEILKDGSLDLPDKILANLDIVGVAIHSYFNLDAATQTKRILKAFQNPYVNLFFHPTGRIINQRPAYRFDFNKVLAEAKKRKIALEINSFPNRLDLNGAQVRLAVEKGVKLAINTDAHRPGHLDYLIYGIGQARRGWSEKKDILNAKPLNLLLNYLRKK